MRQWRVSTVGAVVGLLLPLSIVVVASTAAPASALPSVCTSGASNVRNWIHSDGSALPFDSTSLWNPAGIPGSGPNEILCINTSDHLVLDDQGTTLVHAGQLYLDGTSEVEVTAGASLFVDDGVQSVWGPGTNVAINNNGQLGGAGTIRVQGGVWFASPGTGSVLSGTGAMLVDGSASVVANGLGLDSGYDVDVSPGGHLNLGPGTWLAADPGTTTTIQPGATLDIGGDGGFYRRDAAGSGVLVNNGVLRKSVGTGISVIDATYQGSGQIQVQSGTVAMLDSGLIGGAVWPGNTLATGRCDGPVSTATCQPTTDPAVDAMSVAFTVPQANQVANVQLQELGPVDKAADPQAVGNEVLAHADNLVTDSAHPAQVVLRFSQADVMSTPLDEVQVVHTTDDNQQVLLPACVNGALPSGLWSCVVRPVTRTAQNTFVNVLTTQTSRWRLRRALPVENQGAPSAPRRVTVEEAKPFDGSRLSVSWIAPASSGAGPISAYRVFVDGKLKASPAATSVTFKDAGPGNHTVTVAAVNAAGTGVTAADAIKLAPLSKPRKVTGVDGTAGGKATAGVKWKPPADAGGLTVKGYKIAIFRSNGKKVSITKVKASKRTATFSLPPGKYRFRVRALNRDDAGPWSGLTDAVRCR